MSKYDRKRPITAANCPTREALEREPKLTESIHARHSTAKSDRHRANVLARSNGKSK